jgi:hypothetical protein
MQKFFSFVQYFEFVNVFQHVHSINKQIESGGVIRIKILKFHVPSVRSHSFHIVKSWFLDHI